MAAEAAGWWFGGSGGRVEGMKKLVALCRYKWMAERIIMVPRGVTTNLLTGGITKQMSEVNRVLKPLDPVKFQGFSWGVYEESDEG